MTRISIIGFGRFGKTLYRLLRDDHEITLYDKRRDAFGGVPLTSKTLVANDIKVAYQSEAVFFCVPISAFEQVLAEHKPLFGKQLLIDTLSVKLHPAAMFRKYLRTTSARGLLTHPLFGPDSSKDGFAGLPLVIDKYTANERECAFWKQVFAKKGLRIIEMSARDHDKLAASSQGVTHFIGRLLDEFGFEKTPIDTLGAAQLHKIKEQTCNDTWELFSDLQTYNPYTKRMRLRLGNRYDKLYDKLLPRRVDPRVTVFGIQGGIGSFNEEALLDYTTRHSITALRTAYLFTTGRVLNQLHRGNIDYGLFAMHNSIGGVVGESIRAIAQYKFRIVEEFGIPIRHNLMAMKGVAIESVQTIMAHPQVFKQCKDTLARRYPHLEQRSGKGDLVDTAAAARALAKGKLPGGVAILGPKPLSELYNLTILDRDLQDNKENITSFLLVKR